MEDNNDGGGGRTCICNMVDNGSVESHRYYLARRTVLEMLRDRGYDVLDSEINQSLHEFRSIYGHDIVDLERIRINASLDTDPSKKILVIFCGIDKVRVAIIRGIYTQIMSKEISLRPSRVILVLQDEITSLARKALSEFPFKVEIFKIHDLLINITKHVLKPKHEILTPAEKEKLMKKYSLEDKQELGGGANDEDHRKEKVQG
ncbi:DNA-directed RNA polymerases IV and V subunit 5B-like isoform X2 [Telopea speciosissima]|uniref:DNA-directed RNA polymerases IV and V subunit 5B-like isoform X2 n=1 Tax=Telopea speciosissima TaxID=54955 RepID=UPI001CC64790|nr:DNA-directed RNA polymerases IV and V subunit 5B-like isoform X2 [Telopea speciosissima]